MDITNDIGAIASGEKTALLLIATSKDFFYAHENGDWKSVVDRWQHGKAVHASAPPKSMPQMVGDTMTLTDPDGIQSITVRITDIRMVDIDRLDDNEISALGESVQMWRGLNMRGWYMTVEVVA